MSVGSRGYEFIDYPASCVMSGVSYNKALNTFSGSLMLRQDFVKFCFEYLSYKFGLVHINNVVLNWSDDEWQYPNNKVYRSHLSQDYSSVSKVLKEFHKNFKKSDAEKISY